MRYSLFLSILFVLTQIAPAGLHAQDSTGVSFQALVRTADGKVVTNDTVGVQISILQSSATGESVYTERHTLQTDKLGLLTLQVSTGTATSGSFHEIDWADGPYFVKSEIDPAGDTSYIIMGTFQLLSVPYALHAKRSGRSPVAGRTDGVKIWRTIGSDTVYFGADSVVVIIPGLDSLNPPSLPEGFVNCDTAVTQIVTVTSTTGEIWMDRNLGASRAAESSTDSLAYGNFFQWGRFADGHQCRNSDTTSTLASTSAPTTDQAWLGKFIVDKYDPLDWLSTPDSMLWQGVNGINNPCPSGFRIPTESEWEAEIAEWADSGNENSTGAYNSALKLPLAGNRFHFNGNIYNVGEVGFYWSSSVSGSSTYGLRFTSTKAGLNPYDRGGGLRVRCLYD
jgi:uncharacterized protein (TIGR02145 family)